MENNVEVFSTLGRDNPAVLLVVVTCMALTVAMLGEPRSTIRERPLRGCQNQEHRDFPGGAVVKNLPANAGNTGSSPDPGTRVQALIREDPTCRGATKPVCHNYWALEPASHNYWSPHAATTEARVPRACAPQQREATAMRSPHNTTKSSPRSPQLEKARTQQRRPNAAKKKIK